MSIAIPLIFSDHGWSEILASSRPKGDVKRVCRTHESLQVVVQMQEDLMGPSNVYREWLFSIN